MSRLPRLAVEALEDRTAPAAGDVDPSFGSAGIAAVGFPVPGVVSPSLADARDAVVQADGRIVLAGTAGSSSLFGDTRDFAVVRLNPNGTLDTSFGSGGRATVAFDLGPGIFDKGDQGQAVAVQADGRIVVGGSAATATGNIWAIARLNPDGTLDSSFGAGGRVSFAFNTPGSGVNDLAVQPDGKIVLVGSNNPSTGFSVARLNPNGSFDTTFGGTGKVFTIVAAGTGLGTPQAVSSALTLQPDGRIVVAGAIDSVGGDFAVIRLDPNGALDKTFGTGGKALAGLAAAGLAAAGAPFAGVVGDVALQSDGRIVVVGGRQAGGDFTAVRFTAAGQPDTTFGSGGKAFVPFDLGGLKTDLAGGVGVQPDGKIVLAGRAETGGGAAGTFTSMFAAARLDSTGKLDPTFADAGKRTYPVNSPSPIGNPVGAHAGIFVTNGAILLAGNDTQQMVAIQLLNDIVFNPLPPGPPGPPGPLGPTNGRALPTNGRALPTSAGGGAVTLLRPAATGSGFTNRGTVRLAPFGEFEGVVRTAIGDVNGDGVPDYVLATGPGGPARFAVISGADDVTVLIPPTDPFGSNFTGGAFVAAGDIDGDGRPELVFSPDQGGGPNVVIYNLNPDGSVASARSFFALGDPGFRGGLRVAVGDVNADGFADVVVGAGFLGGPNVAIHDGRSVARGVYTTLIGSGFFAFDGPDAATLRNGVFLAVGDVNADGFADLVIGGGPGGGPRVLILDGQSLAAGNLAGAFASPIANFFTRNEWDRTGAAVGVTDADGDARADVYAWSGQDGPSPVWVYRGIDFDLPGAPPVFQEIETLI